jgi:uncharacterized membrane protein/uncharacterized protein (DUF2141 family)
MNTREKTGNVRVLFLWIIMVVLTCLVYAAGITHESIWYDEAYSSAMASHPLGEIITLTTYDNHPPLYYLLLSLVRMVLGNSEWALRSLSVVGAVGLVSLGAGPVRRLFGDKNAFIYAAVVLFTPAILIYAHEARMYTLAIFAVTAGALFGYLAARYNRTSDWICFGLATLAAAYLHYYGLIAAFFTHLLVFTWLLARKREQIKAYLMTGVIVLAGYLPWLIVFAKQALDVQKHFWLGPVSWLAILLAFLQPFAYKEFYPDILPTMYLALLVSLILVIYGVVIAKRKQAEKESSLSLFLLLVYLGTLITTILVSLFLMPIFYSRYLLVCVGLFLLLTSLGISMLPGRYLPVVAVGIFAILNVFTIKDIYTQKFNYPMKDLAGKLNAAIQPDDLIITSDSYSMGPATYYFPQAVHYYYNNSVEAQWGYVLKPMIPPLHYGEGLESLLSTRKSFWYFSCNTGLSKQVAEILQGEKGWEKSQEPITVAEPCSFVEFTAQKYTYTGRVDAQSRGTLTVHVTGLKPVGYLIFALFDKGPVVNNLHPYLYGVINVAGTEASYSFYDLAYGEYVLEVGHDENKNHIVDMDSRTKLPIEGIYILNFEKVDFSKGIEKGLESITFDLLKFTFDEPEKTVEGEMMYPPFTGESNK